MEKVISVFRIEMVFSMKLTPVSVSEYANARRELSRTQRLDVVLVPAALDVFHHQTGLADLRISNHADLDNHTRVLVRSLRWGLLLLLLLLSAPLVLILVRV
jgi:hypothetical protein